MFLKVFVLGVLKDQKSILPKQIPAQNKVYDLLAALQIVWRVGKYHIKLFAAALQIEENIGVGGVECGKAQLFGGFADEGVVYGVYLHARNAPRTARAELVTNGARTRKQIEHINILKVHKVAQHIKEVLLGEVRSGASPQVAWGNNGPTSVFSADNSHNYDFRN